MVWASTDSIGCGAHYCNDVEGLGMGGKRIFLLMWLVLEKLLVIAWYLLQVDDNITLFVTNVILTAALLLVATN